MNENGFDVGVSSPQSNQRRNITTPVRG